MPRISYKSCPIPFLDEKKCHWITRDLWKASIRSMICNWMRAVLPRSNPQMISRIRSGHIVIESFGRSDRVQEKCQTVPFVSQLCVYRYVNLTNNLKFSLLAYCTDNISLISFPWFVQPRPVVKIVGGSAPFLVISAFPFKYSNPSFHCLLGKEVIWRCPCWTPWKNPQMTSLMLNPFSIQAQSEPWCGGHFWYWI